MDQADWLFVVGRVLLGGLFVVGGIRHLFILPILTEVLAARGLPAARVALVAATAFQIVAGALLMLGLLVPVAVIGLVAFTLAASFLMLNFWDFEGQERENARNLWMSNLAIIGGLLIAAAYTAASG